MPGAPPAGGPPPPTTVNTTIVGNDAAGLAGAISANGGSLTLANTIVWNNNAAGAPAGNFVNTLSAGSFATVTILNSILEDWDARPPSITGANTTGDDPLFVDANGNDNIFGTADDNVRLLPGSPAIDAGNNLFLSPFAAFDVYDQFRVLDDIGTPDTGDAAGFGSVVDIGAAEFQGTSAACAADIAPPLGVFDIFDVIEFLALFDAADPAADLAAPAGVFDIFDVLDYLASTDDC
ncbi:MAG: GC-type dockerin domain-anchored protein [Planctomycetota bacterium]